MFSDPLGVAVQASSPTAAFSWPAPLARFRGPEIIEHVFVLVGCGVDIGVVVVEVVAEVVVIIGMTMTWLETKMSF